jgi:hypothetical protein
LLLVAGAAEWAVRASGMIDFPLYSADGTIGYIPLANQRGSYMGRNDWVVNELNMGAEAFVPGPLGNVLLVGDSVVWGGNPYAKDERLGPQLQRRTAAKVWPIAAGSWGLQNEVTYLDLHPAVVAAVDTVVFVLNSGDFDQPSSWTCELSHPTQHPRVALWFLVRKYVLKEGCGTEPTAALRVPRRNPLEMFAAFVKRLPTQTVLVLLYPNKEELADTALMEHRLEVFAAPLRQAGANDVVLVGRSPSWRLEHYRDPVHPTPEGNAALAELIAAHLTPKGMTPGPTGGPRPPSAQPGASR